jgi:hypothetical protein
MQDYARELDRLVATFRESPELYDPEVVKRLDRQIRPFVANHSDVIRDPLHLSRFPFDVWVVGSIGAMAMLLKTHRFMVGMFFLPILATYLINLSIPLGSIRYGSHLAPLYVVMCAIGLTRLMKILQDSHLRPLSKSG